MPENNCKKIGEGVSLSGEVWILLEQKADENKVKRSTIIEYAIRKLFNLSLDDIPPKIEKSFL